MTPDMIGMALFGFAGLLTIALGIPLLRRRVRPNRLYGLRTRATLGNEAVWYEANARLGRGQVVLGTGVLLLAWGLPLLPDLSAEIYTLFCLGWLVLGSLVLCIRTQGMARRMAGGRSSQ